MKALDKITVASRILNTKVLSENSIIIGDEIGLNTR